MQREKCRRFTQTNKREIAFSFGEVFHIAIGKSPNAQVQQASELLLFPDTLQYEMCVHLSSLPKDHPKKPEYVKRRFEVMMALHQMVGLQHNALTDQSGIN